MFNGVGRSRKVRRNIWGKVRNRLGPTGVSVVPSRPGGSFFLSFSHVWNWLHSGYPRFTLENSTLDHVLCIIWPFQTCSLDGRVLQETCERDPYISQLWRGVDLFGLSRDYHSRGDLAERCQVILFGIVLGVSVSFSSVCDGFTNEYLSISICTRANALFRFILSENSYHCRRVE